MYYYIHWTRYGCITIHYQYSRILIGQELQSFHQQSYAIYSRLLCTGIIPFVFLAVLNIQIYRGLRQQCSPLLLVEDFRASYTCWFFMAEV